MSAPGGAVDGSQPWPLRYAASPMKTRPACAADLAEVVAIYNEAIEHTVATFDTRAFTVDERRAWFEQFGEQWPLLVVESDDVIAGYAYYIPYRAKPAYAATVELTVYVAHRWHGHGVASRLYEALIEHARGRGLHALLAVIAGDNPASEALHRKFGFEPVGHLREVGHKFGRWIDTRYFQRILS